MIYKNKVIYKFTQIQVLILYIFQNSIITKITP